MSTIAETLLAKTILSNRLGKRPWLRSIEVREDQQGWYVKVTVTTQPDDAKSKIPKSLDGVRVVLFEKKA